MRTEFIEEIYPALRNLTEDSITLKFKDGSVDEDGDYNEKSLIVAPILLFLDNIASEEFDANKRTSRTYCFYTGVVQENISIKV